MDIRRHARKNPCMSQGLCPRGAELFAAASQADEEFKAKLVRFFSNTHRADEEMHLIEALGARHRELDEAFHRHRKFCDVCARAPVTVLRYAGAE
jgi:hypothetical protein